MFKNLGLSIYVLGIIPIKMGEISIVVALKI